MDLERENSANESVEDNELNTNQYSVSSLDHNDTSNKVKINGSYSEEDRGVDASRIVDTNASSIDGEVREGIGIEQGVDLENSKPLSAKSTEEESPPLKGYGLRKWRRIRRDVVKDASANGDHGKVLKRGLSISGNPSRARNLMSASDVVQNSEGSVGSTNLLKNLGVLDGSLISESNLESRFAVGSGFAAGEDSENSEDRSSRSSTAASAPRLKYDTPAVLEFVREKNRVKNLSGKNTGSSTQRVQQGKGRAESSKKHRGERVKIEKENSHSSMESDSRSSNFVFLQGAGSVTSNGNQSEMAMFYDGENSDDAHAGEQHFGVGQVNAGEDGDGSQDDLAADASWEGKDEKSNSHRSSKDRDPLVESILTLQSVQEALESEVKKLGEIGKASKDEVDTIHGLHESSLSEQFDSENIRQPNLLESQVSSLTENVQYLEIRLEEAEAKLKAKQSIVAELENSLINGKSARQESESTIEPQQEKSREIEKTELESIYKKKVEAEIEYLTLTKTIQKMRVASGDQMRLYEQQESLAGEQAKMLDKIGDTERKASMLMKQTAEMEKYRGDILGTEEVLKMQRRVCKVTSCFFVQLVLLMLVLLLVLQLSPQSGVVVPT
ncbi:WPP domain-interacting protein 1 [Mercurialis annua]|uniref:WPP domain-interacting protein 1 n=1 Tax=Mercurialis annua TaxID=3986 RepID=UPI002160168E|nr:WPP domain-interacting protein 1 [Mercurialis annua]